MKLVISHSPGDGYEGVDIFCFEYESVQKFKTELKVLVSKYLVRKEELDEKRLNIYLSYDNPEPIIWDKITKNYSIIVGNRSVFAGDFLKITPNFTTDEYEYEYDEPEVLTLEDWFEKGLALCDIPDYNSNPTGVIH